MHAFAVKQTQPISEQLLIWIMCNRWPYSSTHGASLFTFISGDMSVVMRVSDDYLPLFYNYKSGLKKRRSQLANEGLNRTIYRKQRQQRGRQQTETCMYIAVAQGVGLFAEHAARSDWSSRSHLFCGGPGREISVTDGGEGGQRPVHAAEVPPPQRKRYVVIPGKAGGGGYGKREGEHAYSCVLTQLVGWYLRVRPLSHLNGGRKGRHAQEAGRGRKT